MVRFNEPVVVWVNDMARIASVLDRCVCVPCRCRVPVRSSSCDVFPIGPAESGQWKRGNCSIGRLQLHFSAVYGDELSHHPLRAVSTSDGPGPWFFGTSRHGELQEQNSK